LRWADRRFHIRKVLRKYHREALLQVPIDVAVEEPRAGVVSHEPNRNVIVCGADAHDVAHDGVVKVVRRVARAADDAEGMPMQVDGVLIKNAGLQRSAVLARAGSQAHRSAGVAASSATKNGDFNALVAPDRVDASIGEKL